MNTRKRENMVTNIGSHEQNIGQPILERKTDGLPDALRKFATHPH
ncbi:MAG: hypothetical protein V8K32_02220 [Candidatus Electrothrix gigas]